MGGRAARQGVKRRRMREREMESGGDHYARGGTENYRNDVVKKTGNRVVLQTTSLY